MQHITDTYAKDTSIRSIKWKRPHRSAFWPWKLGIVGKRSQLPWNTWNMLYNHVFYM